MDLDHRHVLEVADVGTLTRSFVDPLTSRSPRLCVRFASCDLSLGGRGAPAPASGSRCPGTRSPTLIHLATSGCGAGTRSRSTQPSRPSPGCTWTSMTGTSLKSPISGTLISKSPLSCPRPSKHQPAHVLEDVAEMAGEAGGQRAVDDAVIVGERERQHQPRLRTPRRPRPAPSSSAPRRGSPPRAR